MKRNKLMIGLGIICLLLSAISSWYAVNYNEARLVAPMDFSEYSFRVQDLPMIFSVTLLILYFFAVMILIIRTTRANRKAAQEKQVTRRVNSKWGLMGFFGFLGFAGFWSYSMDKAVYPFVFFIFFGFFGFFFEGRMSNTFIDERYKENKQKADLAALKIGFGIIYMIVFAIGFLGHGRLMENLDYVLIAVIILLAFTIGLTMFLSEYLLYRYDHEDSADESGD